MEMMETKEQMAETLCQAWMETGESLERKEKKVPEENLELEGL